jgi:hypothetical protein
MQAGITHGIMEMDPNDPEEISATFYSPIPKREHTPASTPCGTRVAIPIKASNAAVVVNTVLLAI